MGARLSVHGFGTEQRRTAHPGRRTGLRAMAAGLALLAAVICFCRYGSRLAGDPQGDISAFIGAVRRKSTSAIAALVHAPGLELTESALTPLFRMADLDEGSSLAALEASLRGQLRGEPPAEGYDAFVMSPTPVLFFFRSWRITLLPARLTLFTAAPDCDFTLNGWPVTQGGAGSCELSGLLPGYHDARLLYTGYGMEAASPVVRVPCFSREARAELAFSGCRRVALAAREGDGALYINGRKTDIRPEGGYLRFTAVRGMRVRLEPGPAAEDAPWEFVVEDPALLEEAPRPAP